MDARFKAIEFTLHRAWETVQQQGESIPRFAPSSYTTHEGLIKAVWLPVERRPMPSESRPPAYPPTA